MADDFYAGPIELDDPQPISGEFRVYEGTEAFPDKAKFVYYPDTSTLHVKWHDDTGGDNDNEVKLSPIPLRPSMPEDEIQLCIAQWFKDF